MEVMTSLCAGQGQRSGMALHPVWYPEGLTPLPLFALGRIQATEQG